MLQSNLDSSPGASNPKDGGLSLANFGELLLGRTNEPKFTKKHFSLDDARQELLRVQALYENNPSITFQINNGRALGLEHWQIEAHYTHTESKRTLIGSPYYTQEGDLVGLSFIAPPFDDRSRIDILPSKGHEFEFPQNWVSGF